MIIECFLLLLRLLDSKSNTLLFYPFKTYQYHTWFVFSSSYWFIFMSEILFVTMRKYGLVTRQTRVTRLLFFERLKVCVWWAGRAGAFVRVSPEAS